MGIEPTSQAWEARILPMNYTRISLRYYNTLGLEMQGEMFDRIREIIQRRILKIPGCSGHRREYWIGGVSAGDRHNDRRG